MAINRLGDAVNRMIRLQTAQAPADPKVQAGGNDAGTPTMLGDLLSLSGSLNSGSSVGAQSYIPQQPVYQQPVYQQPAYQQPVYQQPVYQQPAYQQPVYQQPVYQQPVYQQPIYQQPTYPNQVQGVAQGVSGFIGNIANGVNTVNNAVNNITYGVSSIGTLFGNQGVGYHPNIPVVTAPEVHTYVSAPIATYQAREIPVY